MRSASLAACLLALLILAHHADATTTETLSVDFESPAFAVGPTGGVPGFSAGQGGWGGFNGASISNAQAHGVTQSLRTGSFAQGDLLKALDPSLGEYPVGGFFSIGYAQDWWVQAWVRIDPGSDVALDLLNGLGTCPLLQISGAGVPYVHGCTTQDPNQATLGPDAFNDWLLLQIQHTAAEGQQIDFSITGPGISRQISLPQYTGPGSGNLQYLGLRGDAYWDDIAAGYGTPPVAAEVSAPEPGTMTLLGASLAALHLLRVAINPPRRRGAPACRA